MPAEERQHARNQVHEVSRKIGMRSLPDHHQKSRPVLDDCRKLVGFVANARVVGERDPSTRGNLPQPHLILAIRSEVVRVSLYGETRIAQNARKLETKISVGEEDNAQATRSYRTACSISAVPRS